MQKKRLIRTFIMIMTLITSMVAESATMLSPRMFAGPASKASKRKIKEQLPKSIELQTEKKSVLEKHIYQSRCRALMSNVTTDEDNGVLVNIEFSFKEKTSTGVKQRMTVHRAARVSREDLPLQEGVPFMDDSEADQGKIHHLIYRNGKLIVETQLGPEQVVRTEIVTDPELKSINSVRVIDADEIAAATPSSLSELSCAAKVDDSDTTTSSDEL